MFGDLMFPLLNPQVCFMLKKNDPWRQEVPPWEQLLSSRVRTGSGRDPQLRISAVLFLLR